MPKSQRVTFIALYHDENHAKTSLFSSYSFTFAILYLFDICVCHNLILSVNTFPVIIFGLHRFFMHIYVSPLIILLLVEACKCQEIETGAFIKFQLHQFEVWKCIFMELIYIITYKNLDKFNLHEILGYIYIEYIKIQIRNVNESLKNIKQV